MQVSGSGRMVGNPEVIGNLLYVVSRSSDGFWEIWAAQPST
jgi:hypothetical protein